MSFGVKDYDKMNSVLKSYDGQRINLSPFKNFINQDLVLDQTIM